MTASMFSSALIAMLVGYGSSIALVLAAAQAVGASAAQTLSWVAALALAKGVASAGLSTWARVPVLLAWSTPGAALIAATSGIDIHQAAGAFLFSAALVVLTGLVPVLGRLVAAIPAGVAAAMLAGVLFPFVMAVAQHSTTTPTMVLPIVAIFLLVRLFSPIYATLAALVLGIALAFAFGGATLPPLQVDLMPFTFITPRFDMQTLIGLGLPLFLVTMAGQNLPGFAVMRSYGYTPPVSGALVVTGMASMLGAVAGAHGINMAAITAAICLNEEVDPNPATRWRVGLVYGAFWVLVAATGAFVLPLILAMPPALVASIAGLALIAPLIGALTQAVEVTQTRFAAIITFTTTASGIAAFGIGAAFWGLVAGLAVLGLESLRR